MDILVGLLEVVYELVGASHRVEFLKMSRAKKRGGGGGDPPGRAPRPKGKIWFLAYFERSLAYFVGGTPRGDPPPRWPKLIPPHYPYLVL